MSLENQPQISAPNDSFAGASAGSSVDDRTYDDINRTSSTITGPRRKYSKTGCKECKRRKMKCDEGKPACWQCERLAKTCIYDPVKLKKRTRTRKGKNILQGNVRTDKTESSCDSQALSQNLSDATVSKMNPDATAYDRRYQNQAVISPSAAPSAPLPPPQPLHAPQAAALPPPPFSSLDSGVNPTSRNHVSVPNTLNSDRDRSINRGGAGSTGGDCESRQLRWYDRSLPNRNIPGHDSLNFNSVSSAHSVNSAAENDNTNNIQKNSFSVASTENGVSSDSPLSLEQSRYASSNNPIRNADNLFNEDELLFNANLLVHNLNDIVNMRLFEVLGPNGNVGNSSPEDNSSTNITNFREPGQSPQTHFNNDDIHDSDSERMIIDSSNNNKQTEYNSYPLDLSPNTLAVRNVNDDKQSQNITLDTEDSGNVSKIMHIPLSSFHIGEQHQLYAEFFYNDFAKIILPFQPTTQLNPVRDILLTLAVKNSFLLSAILACGARSAFKKSALAEDEEAYCSYLSSCLTSLSKILVSQKSQLIANVEPLLLTVLLLTSDNASSTTQSWRAHLRGAKDLLIMYSASEESKKAHKKSLVLAFCRSWFVSIEILAGLAAPFGGTLESDEELNLLVNLEDFEIEYLKLIHLVRNDGFNLLYGYTNDCVLHLRSLVRLLRRVNIRRNKSLKNINKETNKDTTINKHIQETISVFEITELISQFEEDSKFQIIDKSGVIPEDHYLHPNYNKQKASENQTNKKPYPTIQPISSEAIGVAISESGTMKAYSWYDISHQAYVNAALLAIVTRLVGLPKEAPFVQELVHKIISLIHFLDSANPSRSYNSMLVQWPMLEAGINCIDSNDRIKIERFFRLLAELGAGSAGYSLKKIKRAWYGKHTRNKKISFHNNIIGGKQVFETSSERYTFSSEGADRNKRKNTNVTHDGANKTINGQDKMHTESKNSNENIGSGDPKSRQSTVTSSDDEYELDIVTY